MEPIRAVGGATAATTVSRPVTNRSEEQGLNFGDLLKTALNDVNQLQFDADLSARELLLGRVDMHQAMVAMEKANLAMDLTIQVRNKLVEAYQEIMRMQV